MSEFTQGIVNSLKDSTVVLAVIYTIGHIIIAIICVIVLTGASLEVATADALIEPMINGVWFYFLHTTYKKLS
jgi:uncharacterized membrane protein|tara:strand:+ start:179 stop:397 length:219 start_codon:yes stop_codon:yes gene_type:complete